MNLRSVNTGGKSPSSLDVVGRPLRILVVDDEEWVRKTVISILRSTPQWSVCGEARDGLGAVETARELRPDVVLMDVSMPRMNGLDATRILRRELPDTIIVIVGENNPLIVRLQSLQVNAAGYVGKSSLSRELIPCLERILKERTKISPSGSGNAESGQELAPQPVQGSPVANTGVGQSGDPNDSLFAWLTGHSEVAELIRGKDWAATPLGPVENWSPALRMMVGFLIANRFPLLLWWGPQYISIYNDAYTPILGAKHPNALGLPVKECWSEIWHILKPLIDSPFHGGPATWIEDFELEIRRSGYPEETHFTVAYSPVPDIKAPGGIGGVLATVHEITQKILSERRVSILADLSARATEARTSEQACAVTAEVLASHSKDIPFALIYLIDEKSKQARLAATAGTTAGVAISPRSVKFSKVPEGDSGWPLAEAILSNQMVVVEDINSLFDEVPAGPWSEPPHTAVVVPICSNHDRDLAGLLVAGQSSRLALDPPYRMFLELVAGQIASAIFSARAHEDERRRAEALAEIDRAKTVFFSNVSHEFRTPLTLMLGPLEELIAKGDPSTTPDAVDQLNVVHRNGLRLLKLVNTLLDFSRIEAGRAQASFEEIDLAATTDELTNVFRSAMEKGGLNYTINCPPLPLPVFIDRDMWEKIVFNLLSNAFKFTPTGEVTVTLRAEGNNAVFSVRDTGIGINRWELPNVFKRFHRIENSRGRSQEGTGIGLALTQELVKLHGGSIEVESKPGFGTSFHVSIPFGKEHLPAESLGAARPHVSTALRAEAFVSEALTWLPQEVRQQPVEKDSSPPLAATPASVHRSRILLAEDNADMHAYVRRLLTPTYEVESVTDGSSAWDAILKHTPDLILSDIMMPRMNGLDLVKRLRSEDQYSRVPIILLSARAGEEARIEGIEHGADDYLIKPFSARDLLARVAAHLELARIRRQADENIRQRTAQFETLLNEAPLGVYLVDADFRIRRVNPAALLVFGAIPNLIGRDFDEVIHLLWPKAYADEVVHRFRQTLKTGEPFVVSEKIERQRDRGGTQYHEWQINRIPLPGGRYGVVCYLRDASSYAKAQRSMEESEQRLRSIAEALPIRVFTATPNGELSYINRQWAEFTGMKAQDLQGDGWVKVVHPDDVEECLRRWKASIESGQDFELEHRVRRNDGVYRRQISHFHAMRDSQGNVVMWFGSQTDVDEQTRAAQQH